MSALLMLSVLGLALFMPALGSGDDDETDLPVDPEPPIEPDTLDPLPEPEPETPVEPDAPLPPVNPGVEGVGTPEADRITTQSRASIFGLEGNDTITANADGNGAFVFGGEGEDLISITGSNISANGGTGDDAFSVGGADNTAVGGSGDDFFDVDGNNAIIRGESGNDTISTGIDNTGGLLSGGRGDDDISASGINTDARGEAGNDSITYSAASGTASGGEGDDTLTGIAGDRGLSGTLFGGAGEDILTKLDTAERGGALRLDGGAGDDILTSDVLITERSTETEADTLTGGTDTDTFEINLQFPEAGLSSGTLNIATLTDFDPDTERLNITTDSSDETGVAFRGLSLSQAEDGSFTDVIARYVALDDEGAQTQAVIRLEGVSDLDISRINLSTGDATTSGNDYISSGGVDGDRDATPTLSGGLGDDLLLHEGRDDAGTLVLDGGAGNDTLIASEIEFSNPTTLNGGAGDDLLITELFTPATDLTVDTFTTGEGADTVAVGPLFGTADTVDFGLVARVTDFSPDEDVIVLDTRPFGGSFDDDLRTSFTLTENTTEGFTDVSISLLDDADTPLFSGIVRLEGLTGLSASDIAVALPDGPTEGPSYLYTGTSET